MSSVDNYVLLTSVMDELQGRSLEFVNRALCGISQGIFVQVDQYASGHKNMEANVYLLATNHFPLNSMAEIIGAAPWSQPEAVSLAHKGEGEDIFRLYQLKELTHFANEAVST